MAGENQPDGRGHAPQAAGGANVAERAMGMATRYSISQQFDRPKAVADGSRIRSTWHNVCDLLND
jgi:hypothetical protein